MAALDKIFVYQASCMAELSTCGSEALITIEWRAVVQDDSTPKETPKLMLASPDYHLLSRLWCTALGSVIIPHNPDSKSQGYTRATSCRSKTGRALLERKSQTDGDG